MLKLYFMVFDTSSIAWPFLWHVIKLCGFPIAELLPVPVSLICCLKIDRYVDMHSLSLKLTLESASSMNSKIFSCRKESITFHECKHNQAMGWWEQLADINACFCNTEVTKNAMQHSSVCSQVMQKLISKCKKV
jgi:hypothetical protein